MHRRREPSAGPPPHSEAELVARALALAGSSLGSLADELGVPTPPDLRRAKGWAGRLLELHLGATSASRPRPDFEALGVELKTLPVDRRGYPCESTFVCTIPLTAIGDEEFVESGVWHKLRRVLWVPIEGDRTIVPSARRVGHALIWSPSDEERQALQCDWEEIAGWIGRGDVDLLSARVGEHLQMRPKAANSKARRKALDRDGAYIDTLPRGFYLRPSFTARILAKHFVLPDGESIV